MIQVEKNTTAQTCLCRNCEEEIKYDLPNARNHVYNSSVLLEFDKKMRWTADCYTVDLVNLKTSRIEKKKGT